MPTPAGRCSTDRGRAVTGLLWSALALIWGSTWLFIKVGLEDLPPMGFAGLRFLVAGVPLWAYVALRKPPGPKAARDWALMGVTGLLSISVGYGLVFWAEQHISSGLTAVLFTSFGLFGLLVAHALVPSEPLAPRKLAGVILGMTGVAVIFADQLRWGGRQALWGSLAVTLAAAVQALSSVLIKTRASHLDPSAVTAWQMLVGTGPLLVAGFLLEGSPLKYRWTPLAFLSLGYLALVGSTLAFVLWYALLKRVEVTKAQTIPVMNTLVAVLLGAVVLGERFGLREAAGGACILLGATLVLTAKRKR